MKGIKTILISVSNKTGVVEGCAERAIKLGMKILSTGGTAKTLKDAGLIVTDVSEHTGFPEMMDGRLKTLHPMIHGGLLKRRGNQKDEMEATKYGIEDIDMVVVNLYPFEATISKPGVSFETAIENIDIGGPTMLRSAAKNAKDVVVIVDPNDYGKVFDEIEATGEVSDETRNYLRRKIFAHTAQYDSLIANYLNLQAGLAHELPDTFTPTYRKVADVRYGENPHQKAAVYKQVGHTGLSLVNAKIIQGKEMSFNNYLDSSAVIDLAKEFGSDIPTAVIVKHNNPCGVASAETISEAYRKAFEIDPISAFGGIIHLNRPVDETTAEKILELFCEIIIAPSFDNTALVLLAEKPNIRLIELDTSTDVIDLSFEMRKIQGGLLLQEKDLGMIENLKDCKVVTKRVPTDDEYAAMAFAWRVCKHMKSNAIIYASKDQTLGIGCGQTSRVDSARLAVMKAETNGILLESSAVASDAFFPARDGIDVVAENGIRAIIQPGGSIKDEEIIAACDEHGIAMIFTGMRHFRH